MGIPKVLSLLEFQTQSYHTSDLEHTASENPAEICDRSRTGNE